MDLISKLKKTDLPIVTKIDEIRQSITNNSNLVLKAEPGAGKTTIVPLALLDIIADTKKILLLEPRRLAVRNAAGRMAELLDQELGNTVGYRIKNETKVSTSTRIEVITEGILTRMLQGDPELPEVGLIIFDEFHERSLDADLGLAFSFEVQQTLREDLKLLVMSATLDTKRISNLLNDSATIECEGRCFPVEINYLPPKQNFDWLNSLLIAVRQAIQLPIPVRANQENTKSINSKQKADQDILIFLPGVNEINKAKNIIEQSLKERTDIEFLSLYGDLPFAKQREVLLPNQQKRKIIFSTNIAETSVTIEGVSCVIDSGLMRQSSFDPNVGFDRLHTHKISAESAIQRSGRAGRLGPGHCYRLWPESDVLRAETLPEILRADLAHFVLNLAQWGTKQASDLKLLDQPNQGMFNQAVSLLKALKALDKNGRITDHGKMLLALGVHPRIAHMLIESAKHEATELACLLATMLEEKDLFHGEQRNNPDFVARVEQLVLNKRVEANTRPSQFEKQLYKQSNVLINKLKSLNVFSSNKKTKTEDLLLELGHLIPILLAMVFPDRIAQRRGSGFRLSNGSGAITNDNFNLTDEFLVVVKLGGQGKTPKIFQAVGISLSELEDCFSDLMIECEDVFWDDKNQTVKAEKNLKLGALVLKSQPINNLEPSLILDGLLRGISQAGIDALPWTKELRQWQARIQTLRQLDTFRDEFPDVSDQHLSLTMDTWLAPFLTGLRKLTQLTPVILKQALHNCLDWPQQNKLDELMPLSINVASGSNIKLDYQLGKKPVLAVKLQEMFGQDHSPRIANGQIPVLLHLLSPARRPLQITEDLASFWANGYDSVKKEMRGKYPKHPWPDSPADAQATRYTKNRVK
jgi:ATP-dependent helicase HrpB